MFKAWVDRKIPRDISGQTEETLPTGFVSGARETPVMKFVNGIEKVSVAEAVIQAGVRCHRQRSGH